MADFETYQEYQRLEDDEEDSPPGEEDLLIHVPEGLKGTEKILLVSTHLLLKNPSLKVLPIFFVLFSRFLASHQEP